MTHSDPNGAPTSAADAELADAMDSIQSTGEDWRTRESGAESEHVEEKEVERDV